MNIQWYPGHMTKTRRMMTENISLVDVVIELLDARIPYSSKNPDIDELAKNKRRIIVMNKSDLADPTDFLTQFTGLDLPAVVCGTDDPTDELLTYLEGHVTALIGHSGVGKSTLVNRLVPAAERPTGDVSKVGKGQHTSTQSMAMELPGGGWVVDSPGIRSFGLAHVTVETVVAAFDDLSALAEHCPRGCTHRGEPFDKDCAWDAALAKTPADSPLARRIQAVRLLLIALHSNDTWALGIAQD